MKYLLVTFVVLLIPVVGIAQTEKTKCGIALINALKSKDIQWQEKLIGNKINIRSGNIELEYQGKQAPFECSWSGSIAGYSIFLVISDDENNIIRDIMVEKLHKLERKTRMCWDAELFKLMELNHGK